jgi:branched-chain amino acid transport system ATP-binding protein
MLLRVEGLVAGYGAKEVIHGVDIEVGEREIVAVLGHNGAGKSTLMSAIAGVIAPTGGAMIFNGENLTRATPSAKVAAGLGYGPQGGESFRSLSVTDNLILGGYALPDQGVIPERIARVFELFPPLRERRNARAGSLSGGERQMLSLGALLVAAPKLVILDEPSGGLSPLMVDRMYEAIENVAGKLGASVLLVEQEAHHALEIAHRAYVLANGRVTYTGGAQELANSPELGNLLLGF